METTTKIDAALAARVRDAAIQAALEGLEGTPEYAVGNDGPSGGRGDYLGEDIIENVEMPDFDIEDEDLLDKVRELWRVEVDSAAWAVIAGAQVEVKVDLPTLEQVREAQDDPSFASNARRYGVKDLIEE